MSDKTNLDLAKLKADDEFYTSFADIVTELSHWTDKLRGKNIICPCDFLPSDAQSSITIEFNPKRFYINSVKTKIKSSYLPYVALFDEFTINTELKGKKEISEQQLRNILVGQEVVNFVNYLWAIGESAGIKSITASGYNVKTGKGISFDEVDYSAYDMVITNPPFSLYSAFIENVTEKIRQLNLS